MLLELILLIQPESSLAYLSIKTGNTTETSSLLMSDGVKADFARHDRQSQAS